MNTFELANTLLNEIDFAAERLLKAEEAKGNKTSKVALKEGLLHNICFLLALEGRQDQVEYLITTMKGIK